MKRIILIISTMVLLLLMSISASAITGDGTDANPYLIETEEDFLMIGYFPQNSFKLVADVSISTILNNFEGVLDGDGFTITTSKDYIFSANSGQITDLSIIGGSVASVNSESGNIENCTAQDIVVVETNNGTLSNIQSNTNITTTNNGMIRGCSTSSGYISVNNNVDGTISHCVNSLHIANENEGLIENCSSVDGFLANNNEGVITNCSSTNCFLTTYNSGTIKNCFSTGNTAIDYTTAFVFSNSGTIDLCYSDLDIYTSYNIQRSSKDLDYVAGGLVAYNYGTIYRSFYDGTVYARVYVSSIKGAEVNTCHVGGIAGKNSGNINNCYSKGNISADYTSISATNYIYGDSYLWVAGIAAADGNVENCYSQMAINATTHEDRYFDMTVYAYGIAGNSNIKNCFYVGEDVALSGSYPISGQTTIGTTWWDTASFSKTQVASCGGKFENNTIENSYYLSDAPFEDDSTCGTPLLSSTMKMQTMYDGWDFETIWGIDSERNEGYPYLLWEPEEEVFEEIINVSAITISKDEIVLEKGKTTTLDVSITPDNATNKNVTWTSSNTAVATVIDGTVEAVGTGTATIIVTTEDGNYRALCSIVVTEASEPTVPSDENIPTLKLLSITGKAGGTVTVPMYIENNPGILGMMLKLTYDENLVLSSVVQSTGEEDSALGSLDFTVAGNLATVPVNVAWEGLDADDTNGHILNMTFIIPEDAEDGTIYDISISYTDGEIYDDDLNDIEIKTVDGSIAVNSYTLGDINDDGIINIKDITLLRRGVVGGYDVTLNEAADVNCDGVTNIKDISILRRYVIGGYGVTLGE